MFYASTCLLYPVAVVSLKLTKFRSSETKEIILRCLSQAVTRIRLIHPQHGTGFAVSFFDSKRHASELRIPNLSLQFIERKLPFKKQTLEPTRSLVRSYEPETRRLSQPHQCKPLFGFCLQAVQHNCFRQDGPTQG